MHLVIDWGIANVYRVMLLITYITKAIVATAMHRLPNIIMESISASYSILTSLLSLVPISADICSVMTAERHDCELSK